MIWIAAVLAIFLFYQFVPRNHKILLMKLLAGLVIIIGIIYGIISLYENWEKEKRKSWKSVKVLSLKESSEVGKKELTVKVCNNRSNSDLLKFEVDVRGFKSGRSTGSRLFTEYTGQNWEGDSTFKSDIIVKRNSCEIIVWIGDFISYDSYEAKTYEFYDKWSD